MLQEKRPLISYDHLQTASAEELLRWALDRFGRRFALLTSFQSEGMVLLDLAVRINPEVRVVTLDTGRLPPETFDMIEMVRKKYGVKVETVLPEPSEVERMVAQHGPNLFRESVPLRTLCCHVRKVRPLDRKLAELDAWAVGLRRDQTESRGTVQKVVEIGSRLKLSPLADWSRAAVAEYVAQHSVPVHPLYEAGYRSIGCAPCTRAVRADEDERAGRWWWEQGAGKECGLHFSPDGRVERTVDILIREVVAAAPN